MKKLRILLFSLSVFALNISKAQLYGNEWIDTTKAHVKIKVYQDAIYRVGYFSIEQAFSDRGQFLTTIPFDQFRMFNMGKQVPIFVKDQNGNNRFDPFDFIEFVGHPLDGAMDTELYKTAGEQRHAFQSMMSDSNYYYFTFRTTGSPLRYVNYQNSNPPLSSPKAFHTQVASYYPAVNFHNGIPLQIGDKQVFSSEYAGGKGFIGDIFNGSSDSNSIQYKVTLQTPFLYKNGPKAVLESGLIGISSYYGTPNHHIVYHVGPSQTQYRRLGDSVFLGSAIVKKTFLLDTSDFGPSSVSLLFNSRFINGINFSTVAHSHTVLKYPKTYNLGDSSRYVYTEDTSSVAQNIEWIGYGDGLFSVPVLYDEDNLLRIQPTYSASGRKISYSLPPLSKRGKTIIMDEGRIRVLDNIACQPVVMKNYDIKKNRVDYIIVTAEALLGVKEEIYDYANFWSTRFSVDLNFTEDLYNSFSYGVPHPLAIRHYCKYLLDNASSRKPQYLLLLGRGYDNAYNRGTAYNSLKPHQKKNHVPTFGTPVSDNLFTAGLDGTKLEPAIATGRVPADFPEEIGAYLDKLKAYVNSNDDYQEWHKNVLHLSGGVSTAQAFVIKNKLMQLEKYPLKSTFAGFVRSYSRAAGSSVDVNFRTSIMNNINNGVNLVTFLGHGSLSVTDIDVGDPEDYLNEGKYPICYFNGCQVGNPCLPVNTLGLSERMFRARKKGAVAFIGQTSLSELYTVSDQMEHFYKSYFDSNSKKGIGDVMKATIKTFQSGSQLNKITNQQLFLQGDPALPVYSPQLPDYGITNSSLFIDPPNTIALQDSFRLGIEITNYGRGISDSFSVNVTRTYPDGVTQRSFFKKWQQSKLKDTVYFVIRSKDIATKGENIFSVVLNMERSPVEFDYNNNQATMKYYMPANGINLVMPKKFAIVGTDSVELVMQKSDLFKESEDFYAEIDTTPWFNSPMLISLNVNNTPLNAGVMATWKVPLKSNNDTQVYFWRARINAPIDEGGSWVISTFTHIKNHGDGWMQNMHWQYNKPVSLNQYNTLLADSATNSLKFTQIVKKIYIDCQYKFTSNLGVKESGFGSQDMNFGVCKTGIVCIPWDSRKLERRAVDTSKIKPDCYWGSRFEIFGHMEDYQLYYAFDMGVPEQQLEFIKFVDAMDDGMYVTIFSRFSINANGWSPDVLAALNRIGSAVFDTADRRTPDAMWVCLGKKGWQPGMAQEAHTYGNTVPYVQVEGEMVGEAEQGDMISETIGTSNAFQTVYYSPKINFDGTVETDKLTIDVLGQNNNGNYEVLKSDITKSPIDIRNVNSSLYKFLKLRVKTSDESNRTSPNLYNWRVVHDSVPEGSIYPDIKYGYKFHSDSLYEGDTFSIQLPFVNIGHTNFRDSLVLEYSLQNKVNRQILLSGTRKYQALKKDSFFVFKLAMPTTGLDGPFGLSVSVNSQYKQPEVTLTNNSAVINFYVQKDVISPKLEVTFDGRNILNGDIVSSNPVILITSKDENKYLWQKDTAGFDLMLKRPGSSTYEEVRLGTDAVYFAATDNNNNAKIEYKPQNLSDGLYHLKVQSRDAKLNAAGKLEYEIGFNVINEESVTNFYPYPNPFTTRMRFVFTLTGNQVPDDIRVKIMTAEGRVVKEVTKEDLGDIHIGNNITQWEWDGTDQFGDKLANGTYFYKVTVKNNGDDLKLRASKGDASFKEQVGVIYLMR